jgi:hypothetical protein
LMAWRLIVVLFSDSQTDDRIRWVGDIGSVIERFSLCQTWRGNVRVLWVLERSPWDICPHGCVGYMIQENGL